MKNITLALASCCALLAAGGAAAQNHELVETSPGEYRLKYRPSTTLSPKVTVPGVVLQVEILSGGDVRCEQPGAHNPGLFDFRSRLTDRLHGQGISQLQALLASLEAAASVQQRYNALFALPWENRDTYPTSLPTGLAPVSPAEMLSQQRGEPTRLQVKSGEKCLTSAQLEAAIAEGRRVVVLILEELRRTGKK